MTLSVQILQNHAARILTFSSYEANSDPLLGKLSWGKLVDQLRSHMAIMVYESLEHHAPDCLRSKFVDLESVSSHALRETAVPQPRPNYLIKKASVAVMRSGIAYQNSFDKLRRYVSLDLAAKITLFVDTSFMKSKQFSHCNKFK